MSGKEGLGPASARLEAEVRLQRAAEHLHQLGPRPVGAFIAELIDNVGVSPAYLDRLLDWQRLDPAVIAAIGANQFPTPPLHLVKSRKRLRRQRKPPVGRALSLVGGGQ